MPHYVTYAQFKGEPEPRPLGWFQLAADETEALAKAKANLHGAETVRVRPARAFEDAPRYRESGKRVPIAYIEATREARGVAVGPVATVYLNEPGSRTISPGRVKLVDDLLAFLNAEAEPQAVDLSEPYCCGCAMPGGEHAADCKEVGQFETDPEESSPEAAQDAEPETLGLFDTSGAVDLAPPGPPRAGCVHTLWSDLSPFTQGHVEALFAGGVFDDESCDPALGKRWPDIDGIAFSDLAPETLARIMEDCAFMEARKPYSGDEGELDWSGGDHAAGAQFWLDRQAERWPASYPPLTPYLGDDGKVYLREGV